MGVFRRNSAPTRATTTATSNDDSSLQPRAVNRALNDGPPSTANKTDLGVTKRTTRRSKYRHVAAYHSELRHSSLSRDSNATASFLGFRNLMVIVLGRSSCPGLGFSEN